MQNIVNELNALKNAIDTETVLRKATDLEIIQGVKNGKMHQAHDEAIQAVIEAAKKLVEKSNV